MTAENCGACAGLKATPIPGVGVTIVFDPRITMPGSPTISGQRLPAQQMATRVHEVGPEQVMREWELTREECLVACWWAGLWGPLRLRRALGDWAATASLHLWYGCINIPAPPREGVEDTQ